MIYIDTIFNFIISILMKNTNNLETDCTTMKANLISTLL